MTTALLVFFGFIAVALIGWGLCELKGKDRVYQSTETEKEQEAEYNDASTYREKSLQDILDSNSTKGYNAV